MKLKSLVIVACVLLSFGGLVFLTPIESDLRAESGEDRVLIYFFRGEGCPHCAREEKFLEELTEKHPEVQVRDYEVWNHPENREVFTEMMEAYGIERKSVPLTFVGMRHWVGYSPKIGEQITRSVKRNLPGPGLDPGRGIVPPPDTGEIDGAGPDTAGFSGTADNSDS